MPDTQQDVAKPSDSPFYCFAVGIAPEVGSERIAYWRLVELGQRNRWLVRMRWLAAGGMAAAAVVGRWALGVPVPVGAVFALAAVLAALNAVLFALTRRPASREEVERRRRRETALATVQIAADLVVLTALIHFTGGIENPFFFYFIFHMIIASILLSRRASFYIATLATALFTALVLAERYGALPHVQLWRFPARLYEDGVYTLAVLVVFATTMYLAVYFAGAVVQRLRARDEELITMTSNLERGSLELSEAYEKFRALEARKSEFFLLVAHQLRSPLSAIRSLMDVVLDGFAKDPARQVEMLRRAHDRADLMLGMVNDLLALTRLKDAPETSARAETVDVSAIAAEVETLYRPKASQKGVRLALEEPQSPLRIKAAADDVRQVINNLLDNAINYTPAGGSVVCTVERSGALVCVRVADTGIGIPEEDRAGIFTEFFRAPNAKRTVSHGTGLGLAIVKRTAERWNGRVSFTSAAGRGTTFLVEFPAV